MGGGVDVALRENPLSISINSRPRCATSSRGVCLSWREVGVPGGVIISPAKLGADLAGQICPLSGNIRCGARLISGGDRALLGEGCLKASTGCTGGKAEISPAKLGADLVGEIAPYSGNVRCSACLIRALEELVFRASHCQLDPVVKVAKMLKSSQTAPIECAANVTRRTGGAKRRPCAAAG